MQLIIEIDDHLFQANWEHIAGKNNIADDGLSNREILDEVPPADVKKELYEYDSLDKDTNVMHPVDMKPIQQYQEENTSLRKFITSGKHHFESAEFEGVLFLR